MDDWLDAEFQAVKDLSSLKNHLLAAVDDVADDDRRLMEFADVDGDYADDYCC